MNYIIGIDGGGTKTLGLLTTETGERIAQVQAGPSNYHVVGETETKNVLTEVVTGLFAQADISTTSCPVFCLGMAGLGRAEDKKVIGQICNEIGISSNRILTHDAHIGLVGGTGKQEGVIVISGTGSIVYGIDRQGEETRAGGWGYLIGDEGSGYDIALKGLQAVARATDDRDMPTALTNRILSRLELNEPSELIRWVHAGKRDEIAQLAQLVFRTAETGDTITTRIINSAVDELVCAAGAVIKQLTFTAPFDIVLSGGNLVHQPMFADKLRTRLATIAPMAEVILPRHEPVYGAVLLAQARL